MKTLKELSDKLEKFDNLPKEEKNNILELIDLKTELDMKEVISRFDSMQSEMKSMQSKFDSKFSILLWVVSAIGLMISIIGFMIVIFKFLW